MSRLSEFLAEIDPEHETPRMIEIKDDLVKMSSPESYSDETDAANAFDNVLGWNPQDFYERKAAARRFDEVMEDESDAMRDSLMSSYSANSMAEVRSEVVEKVVNIGHDIKPRVVDSTMRLIINEAAGDSPKALEHETTIEEDLFRLVYGADYDEDDDDSDDDENLEVVEDPDSWDPED